MQTLLFVYATRLHVVRQCILLLFLLSLSCRKLVRCLHGCSFVVHPTLILLCTCNCQDGFQASWFVSLLVIGKLCQKQVACLCTVLRETGDQIFHPGSDCTGHFARIVWLNNLEIVWVSEHIILNWHPWVSVVVLARSHVLIVSQKFDFEVPTRLLSDN